VFWAVTEVIADVPKTPRAAKVFRSAWIPAPPPESDPAMVSARHIGLLLAAPHLVRPLSIQPPATSLLTKGEESLARGNRVIDSSVGVILARDYPILDERVQSVREKAWRDRQLLAIQRVDRFFW
jgi:hypothetical protein